MESRLYFMKTPRLGFSRWERSDIGLARKLWLCPEVSRFICASGRFSEKEVSERLALEISNGLEQGVEYWPIFELSSGQFAGCCGLRPHGNQYEFGIHLLPSFWGKGFASEAGKAVIRFAFDDLNAEVLFASHHPNNEASRKLLSNLGFTYVGDEFYPPTGLNHPSYELKKNF